MTLPVEHQYDEEGDVLYFSFGRSEHVTTIELSEHLLLRLELGDAAESRPRAIGLTVLFPARLLQLGHRPMRLDLNRLRRLPPPLQSGVLEVLATPPVSELLSVELTFALNVPPLPALVAA